MPSSSTIIFFSETDTLNSTKIFHRHLYNILLIRCKFNCCSHQLTIYQIHSQELLRMSLNSRNSETATSLLNSTTFLLNVREPLKQRKLDFIKAKHIFVRIQFMVIDFGKSCFSESKSDNLE